MNLCRLTLPLLVLLAAGCGQPYQAAVDQRNKADQQKAGAAQEIPQAASGPVRRGLIRNEPDAFQGYTLLAPMNSWKTYLIDMQGRVVHVWQSYGKPFQVAYLLSNGHLLRPTFDDKRAPQDGGGARIQEYTWQGELDWDFRFGNADLQPHHDVCKLRNGNVLIIAVDRSITTQDCLERGAGKLPPGSKLHSDCIFEVKPTGKTTGEVVWQWRAWDHLIQDFDNSKRYYGNVRAHPELLDINYRVGFLADLLAVPKYAKAIGDIGYINGTTPQQVQRDWLHLNCVAYNEDLDQIMLTTPNFSEVWVIDHGTTTAEAAGHTGGKRGKGGDLLYRWGNPRTYRAATFKDQKFFYVHDGHWIDKGLPGAGHILAFNNGGSRPDGNNYSSVDEFEIPMDASGSYLMDPNGGFGPDKLVWSYTAPKKSDFFSVVISGAQRLPNGNTLICSGNDGKLFEVTDTKEVVWEYLNPVQSHTWEYNLRVTNPIIDDGEPGPARKSPAPPPGGGVFRAYRYGPNYPAFDGKDLKPGKTIEELQGNVAKEK